jgi:threonine aldolase
LYCLDYANNKKEEVELFMSKGPFIDLRSDTVTKPSAAMREAMANAEVGDDVFGEDPTINLLQKRVADILGKEKALYVSSGVMGNQLAIKAQTEPGDEIICEQDAHIFNYETAAPAVISSVQIRTIPGKKGIFSLDQLPPFIRPKAYYLPRTKMICLENTHNRAGGTIYPIEEIRRIAVFARQQNIVMHLDGARLWNASVASGISPSEYAAHFDSVSVCFSKGLGAPVGSAVAGTAEFIEKVRKWRKVLGGGMRQAGVIAAGALFALENNIPRLKEDHEKAQFLAQILSTCKKLDFDKNAVQTNILIINISKTGLPPEAIIEKLHDNGVLVTVGSFDSIRAVTHLDVSMEEVKRAAEVFMKNFN